MWNTIQENGCEHLGVYHTLSLIRILNRKEKKKITFFYDVRHKCTYTMKTYDVLHDKYHVFSYFPFSFQKDS